MEANQGSEATKTPWHQSTGCVVPLMIFFFPVGLILLWLHPTWKMKSKLAVSVIAAILIIPVLATMGDPPQNGGSSTWTGGTTKTIPPAPAISVTAQRLVEDYKANEVAADQKYNDRTLEVTGIVGDIKKDILGKIYVVLGSGKQYEVRQVQCFFSDDWADRAARLKKGQRITISGRCTGLMMNVLLDGCVIK